MIQAAIAFSVRNRALVLCCALILAAWGWWSMRQLPLDALPDLSDTQVIIYSRWDRSPNLVEAQVTYPIVTAMLGAPKVKAVRGQTDFGYSFVYVVFEEGTDIYWARSRVQEFLSTVQQKLPQGVQTELGPDASGVGWVYQYVLTDSSGKHDLAELRSLQDWYLRYHLRSVPGVAEVASVGGFGKQYQVNIDPNRLQQYGLSVQQVVAAVRESNEEGSGRVVEFGATEYMVRGRGYIQSVEDLGEAVLSTDESGAPIRIRDIGEVTLGPDMRRGVADLDGRGEAVSGIVVVRYGENALEVIERVKARLAEVKAGLPPGVEVTGIYDRSNLIREAIATISSTTVEVMITVSLIILIFLWHVPSAAIPVVTIPLAVLISFIPFRLLGLSANIMSLGGIVLAIGALVDAAIVVVEQSHKKLEVWDRGGRKGDFREVVIAAIQEVGRPSFLALLVISVSFLPVLALENQEGRLFRPLAYTKNLAMIVAAVLAVTVDPALRMSLLYMKNFSFRPAWICSIVNTVVVGRIRQEETHPLSRILFRVCEPAVRWALRRSGLVIAVSLVAMAVTVPVFLRLGSEFMPSLDEGSILYMPSTMPGISVTEARRILQVTDMALASFPEVDRVLGKAGRAESATDPAPLSMLETVITLKEKSKWRRKQMWYSSWAPEWMKSVFRLFVPDNISQDELIAEMNQALQVPGASNSWTMPIRARIDMQSTGIRTPVGLKVQGPDLRVIDELAQQVEKQLASIPGTRGAFAERIGLGHYLDFEWNRAELARYGLSIQAAQTAVQNAIGGENISMTVEGRERYPVNVRYKRDYRSDIPMIERIVLPAAGGKQQVTVGQVAAVRRVTGPAMIRDEDGMLTTYVYVDLAGRDPSGYVAEARAWIERTVPIPIGYSVRWSGQYEAIERVRHRLMIVIPAKLALIVVLLYLNTRSMVKLFIVLLAVPFSAIGAVWFLYLLDYNMSTAVWVGMIALLGVDSETGVFMLLYLDLAYNKAMEEGTLTSLSALDDTLVEGAVKRIRPKFMTVATDMIGLVPVLWATGTGADVMKRIAAPLIGGLFTSFLLELLVYPVLYKIWKWKFELRSRM